MNRDCSELPIAGKSVEDIALARCDCLMERYLEWKLANHRKSDLAQRVTLVFTSITPVLLLIQWEYVKVLAAVAAAVATIATGFMAISGWRDNFVRYGYAWHALQTEKFLYLAQATQEYANKDREEAARHFAFRIEEIVTAEVTAWRANLENLQGGRKATADEA